MTQPWPIHRNRRGAPRWYQRCLESWWVLTGQWSLHRAWQDGLDQGSRNEYRRIIVNGGDLVPVIDAAIYVTADHIVNGQEPQFETLCHLRKKAWDRFKTNRRGVK